MKQKSIVKMLLIMLPLLFIGLFIIGVSWTFGTSVAGQSLGTLEGVLLILTGPLVVFWKEVKKFLISAFQSTKKLFKK